MNILELAELIAKESFRNKKDKAGRPYYGHLNRVREMAKISAGNWDYIQVVALLHDLLEDCPEWNETILRHFFSTAIVDSIVFLTKTNGQNYDSYIENISNNEWARVVKIADLKDNMDITRLESLDEKDFERLNKYHKAYKKLTSI